MEGLCACPTLVIRSKMFTALLVGCSCSGWRWKSGGGTWDQESKDQQNSERLCS